MVLQAQDETEEKVKPSPDNALLLSPSYTLSFPSFDLADRFGVHSNVGMHIGYKFGKNWLVGAEGNFLFGTIIREADPLLNLATSNGGLINTDGDIVSYRLFMRGAQFKGQAGKIFNFNAQKPNNGVLVMLGAGLMQHRLIIDVEKSKLPQLSDDYQKGYDLKTQGFMLTQFIGLIRLEREKFVNLYFGVELAEGFTKSVRPWDFDTNMPDDESRFDMQIGIKLGWIIPVFGSKSQQDYYYY